MTKGKMFEHASKTFQFLFDRFCCLFVNDKSPFSGILILDNSGNLCLRSIFICFRSYTLEVLTDRRPKVRQGSGKQMKTEGLQRF